MVILLSLASLATLLSGWFPSFYNSEPHRLFWHTVPISIVSFSPCGKLLVVGAKNQSCAIWDLSRSKQVFASRCCEVGEPDCVVYSPDGRWIAISCGWTGLTIETSDGKTFRSTPEAHERLRKNGITWGRYISEADECLGKNGITFEYNPFGNVSTITIVDTKTWKRGDLTEGLAAAALTNSSDGRSVIRALFGARRNIFLDENDRPIPPKCQKPYFISRAQFSADGRFLVTEGKAVGEKVSVQLYEVSSGKVCAEFDVPMRVVFSIALAPAARFAAVTGVDADVRVFDFFTREIHSIPNKFRGKPQKQDFHQLIVFSPDAKRLVVSLPDNTLQIVDPLTGTEIAILRCPSSPVTALTVSPDCRTLAAGLQNGSVLLYDISRHILRGNPAQPKPTPPQAQGGDRSPSRCAAEQWWTDLASDDAAKAYRAVWHMASHPRPSLPLLATRLRPETNPLFERLPQLLSDLDADTFSTRERAGAELRKAAARLEPNLRHALAKAPSVESHHRLQSLLDSLDPVPPGITLRDARAIGVLERIGGSEARKILRRIAQAAPQAPITHEAKAALQRLSPPRPGPSP